MHYSKYVHTCTWSVGRARVGSCQLDGASSVAVSRVVSPRRRRDSITQTTTTPNGELCKFNDDPSVRAPVPRALSWTLCWLHRSAFVLFSCIFGIVVEVRQFRWRSVATTEVAVSECVLTRTFDVSPPRFKLDAHGCRGGKKWMLLLTHRSP